MTVHRRGSLTTPLLSQCAAQAAQNAGRGPATTILRNIDVRGPPGWPGHRGLNLVAEASLPPRARGISAGPAARAVIKMGASRSMAPRNTASRNSVTPSCSCKVANVGDEHDAVARGNPKDGDKPDERSHREHPTGGIDPGDAADQRQRQVHHDECRIAEGPKGQRQESRCPRSRPGRARRGAARRLRHSQTARHRPRYNQAVPPGAGSPGWQYPAPPR